MFVTEKERKEIAEKYTFVPKDSNIPTEIVNIQKVAKLVQEQRKKEGLSMVIEISPIIIRKDRDLNRGITQVKDPLNNVVYGIYAGLDDFKNVIWARISLENGITLNLENIVDAQRWVVLRMHPLIKGSPFERDPLFKVEDPSIEAAKTTKRVQKIEALMDLVKKMDGNEIVDALRYLGEPVNESLNFDIAKASLMNRVLKSPESVYDLMGNKKRSLEAKIIAAIEYNIIEEHPEHGFRFNNINLGLSRQDVVNMIEKDNNVKSAVLKLVKDKDSVSANLQDQYESKKESDSKKADKIKI